eukprot:gene11466-34180_t
MHKALSIQKRGVQGTIAARLRKYFGTFKAWTGSALRGFSALMRIARLNWTPHMQEFKKGLRKKQEHDNVKRTTVQIQWRQTLAPDDHLRSLPVARPEVTAGWAASSEDRVERLTVLATLKNSYGYLLGKEVVKRKLEPLKPKAEGKKAKACEKKRADDKEAVRSAGKHNPMESPIPKPRATGSAEASNAIGVTMASGTHEIDWDRINKTKFFLYGMGAFSGVTTVLYPLTVVKTKIQASYGASDGGFKEALKTAKSVLRSEGVVGLYRGYTTIVFGMIPGRMVYLTALELSKSTINRLGRQLEVPETALAAMQTYARLVLPAASLPRRRPGLVSVVILTASLSTKPSTACVYWTPFPRPAPKNQPHRVPYTSLKWSTGAPNQDANSQSQTLLLVSGVDLYRLLLPLGKRVLILYRLLVHSGKRVLILYASLSTQTQEPSTTRTLHQLKVTETALTAIANSAAGACASGQRVLILYRLLHSGQRVLILYRLLVHSGKRVLILYRLLVHSGKRVLILYRLLVHSGKRVLILYRLLVHSGKRVLIMYRILVHSGKRVLILDRLLSSSGKRVLATGPHRLPRVPSGKRVVDPLRAASLSHQEAVVILYRPRLLVPLRDSASKTNANSAAGACASLSTQVIVVPIDVVSQRQMVGNPGAAPPAATATPPPPVLTASVASATTAPRSPVTPHASTSSAPTAAAASMKSGPGGTEHRLHTLASSQYRPKVLPVAAFTAGSSTGSTAVPHTSPSALSSPFWRRNMGGTARQGGGPSPEVRSGLAIARLVIKEEGIRGLYRGFGASVATFVPSSALWWGCYGVYQQTVWSFLGNPSGGGSLSSAASAAPPSTSQIVGVQVVSAMFAGASSSFMTSPLDLVKTRIQVASKGDGRASTVRGVLEEILREDGWRGMFRGALPRMANAALWGTCMVSTYEMLKRVAQKKPSELAAM